MYTEYIAFAGQKKKVAKRKEVAEKFILALSLSETWNGNKKLSKNSGSLHNTDMLLCKTNRNAKKNKKKREKV